jgi:hypothetical protein
MPKPVTKITALIALIAIALIAACGTDDTTNTSAQPSAPYNSATTTLEEILERTRSALNEVTSYQSRGTMIVKSSSDDPSEGGTGEISTAWQSPDRHRMTMEGVDYDSGDPVGNEILTIGNQQFFNLNWPTDETEWHEMAPIDTSVRVHPAEKPLLYLLDNTDIELLSPDKILEDGSRAIELKINQAPTSPETFGPELIDQAVYHIVLIDPTTFLFIHQTTVAVIEFEDRGSKNGVQYTELKRIDQQFTYEFFDYNVPLTIEAPNNYQPWQGPRPGVDPTPTQPAHTPTPFSEFGCYERETAWPGCGLRTEAEVREMLTLFPSEALIVVDEDTVVTIATDAIPNINWPADAFIWHIPTASVAMACYTHESPKGETTNGETANPPYPLRLHGTRVDGLNAEGGERLTTALKNDALMAQILSKAGTAEVDCSFIR